MSSGKVSWDTRNASTTGFTTLNIRRYRCVWQAKKKIKVGSCVFGGLFLGASIDRISLRPGRDKLANFPVLFQFSIIILFQYKKSGKNFNRKQKRNETKEKQMKKETKLKRNITKKKQNLEETKQKDKTDKRKENKTKRKKQKEIKQKYTEK